MDRNRALELSASRFGSLISRCIAPGGIAMAGLRKAFGVTATLIRFLLSCVRYVRRKRLTAERRPKLQLDFIHPPYWGAERLDFAISNTGGGKARNCRYCRLQEFTMAGPVGGPAAFSARRWYSSDRLDLPPGGHTRSKASLTLSPCPRGILGDVVQPPGNESSYQDAIVCQDSTGTAYRFRCFEGADVSPDTWSAGLLDRFRGVTPPAWAEWAASPGPVERVQWSEVR